MRSNICQVGVGHVGLFLLEKLEAAGKELSLKEIPRCGHVC